MTSARILAELRQQISAGGWDRKATGQILFELSIHVFLALAGIAVIATFDSWWVKACGLIVSTTGSIGVGTNSHTSSHYGTSDRKWVNELLSYFGYPFFLGLSATFWWHQHVTIHHPSPNLIGIDDDADLSPWFAMTQAEIEAASGLRRWYYEKAQWLVFPLALAANGFNFTKTGVVYLIRMLRDPEKRRSAHWIDLTALMLHFGCYLGLPVLFFSARDVLTVYLFRTVSLGYAMFVMQAPGHFPAEAARLSADQQKSDHLLIQTANSVDFRAGFIGRLFSSGLGYQIEHHLFPNLSHVHYRKISPMIEQMCRENGFPYHAYGWDSVVWKCWMVLRYPPPIINDAGTLRIIVEEAVSGPSQPSGMAAD